MTTNFSSDRVIVKLNPTASSSEITNLQAEIGVTRVTTAEQFGIDIWEIPSGNVEETISAYNDDPRIEYIEPDYIITLDDVPEPDDIITLDEVQKTSPTEENLATIVPQTTTPNDPRYPQLWGLNNIGQTGGTPDADIDAPEAWDIQTGNPNLVIGVIDTGVDYNHPDLVDNIWTNPGEIAGNGIDDDNNGYIDDVRGWDFAYNDNNPMDVHRHGTHVSGTIAGKGNNSVGVTGVAWNAKIMPLKFLNDSGSGSISNAILALNYATAKGVKLTNNSWGGGPYSQGLYDAINTAGQQGALFIAAAGNTRSNNDITPFYPASYDLSNIISVAATDHNDALANFSHYGLTSVDLGAPGSNIYSTIPRGNYGALSGTSMASPHVAGGAALVWSQNPTWTAQQVKNRLLDTTDPKPSLSGRTVSGGRLNLYNALPPADTTPPTASSFSPADNATGVGVGANLVINFSEAIQKGTGNLVIKTLSDNSVVETIPVTAANVTVSGSQLTIDPTANLAQGTDYYVEIANGAIKDIPGNNYAGITGNSTWNFTTVAAADTTPPTAIIFSPADNATGVGVLDNLVIYFSEAIQIGAGILEIKKLSDNSVVESFGVTAPNGNVTATGNQVTINPSTGLVPSTGYYVEIPNGAFKDMAGNNYAGFTGNSTWNFTTNSYWADTTPPIVWGFSPADNATGVGVLANLVMYFNEAIQIGAGIIQIKKLSDNSVVESLGVTAPNGNVSANGNVVTINPSTGLFPSTGYYVEIPNGAFKDIAGNNYAGFTGNSTWNFTTNSSWDSTTTGRFRVPVVAADNNRGGNSASLISLDAIAGTTDQIAVDGYNSATDPIQLNITPTPPGSAGAGNLTGTANADTINGLPDTIPGNAKNTLQGGADEDPLTGGRGADTLMLPFAESSVSAKDPLTDFGSEKIDLLTEGGVAMNVPSLFSPAANSIVPTLEKGVIPVFTEANGALAGNQALEINSEPLRVAKAGWMADIYRGIYDAKQLSI
jgi:subtilisin family serine protease